MKLKVLSSPQVCLNRNDDAELYVVALAIDMNSLVAARIDDRETVPAIGDIIEVASIGRSYLPR